MKISLKKSTGIVAFSTPPARIMGIDYDNVLIMYKMSFDVDLAKAVKNDTNSIELDIYIEDPAIFQVKQPETDPLAITSAILSASTDQKKIITTRRDKIIASTKIDITTKIDNSKIPELKTERSTQVTSGKQFSISPVQITTLSQESVTSTPSKRQSSALGVLQSGIDPATANELSVTTISASNVVAGTSIKTVKKSSPKITSKLHDLVFAPSIGTLGQLGQTTNVVTKFSSATTKIAGNISISNIDLKSQQYFFAVAKLVSSKGRTVSEVKMRIDHAGCLKIYNTPHTAPDVKISSVSGGDKINIDIKQLDKKATKIFIYRKLVSFVDTAALNGEFTKIADIETSTKDGIIKFTDVSVGNKIAIYRFIPVGSNGEISSDFSSAVYRPTNGSIGKFSRYDVFRAVAITTQNTDTGILISLSSLPKSASSICVLRRDMTLLERDFSFINTTSPIVRIDDVNSTITFSDTSTKHAHIYEYTCRMYSRDGSEYQCVGSCLVKRIVPSETGIQLTLSNIEIDKSSSIPDVKFNLSSVLSSADIDVTSAAIESAGLTSKYSAELTDAKSDFGDLVTHNVTRIDTTTGETMDFGTIVGDSFSDVTSRTSSVTSDIVQGRKYKYVVSTQLRSADSLLPTRTIEKIDSYGRKHTYSPQKYLNPITLKTGTLPASDGTTPHHPEDPFKQGIVGNETSIDVTIPSGISAITQAVFSSNQDQGTIKFSLSGDSLSFDHFDVFSVAGDSITSLGKMQATPGTSYEFSPEPDDTGGMISTSFIVVPITSDFLEGAKITLSAVQK